MAVAAQGISRAPRPSSLADVLEIVLDKGIVIDAYVRVAVVGIELLTVDARVVIASVDTYLRFAEAVNRLDLRPQEQGQVAGIPGMVHEVTEGGAEHKTKGALEGVKEKAEDFVSNLGHDEEADDEEAADNDADNGADSSSDGGRRRKAPAGRSAPRSRRGGGQRRKADDS